MANFEEALNYAQNPGSDFEERMNQLVRAIAQGFHVPAAMTQPGVDAGLLSFNRHPPLVVTLRQELEKLKNGSDIKQAIEAGLNPGAAGDMNPYAARQYLSPKPSSQFGDMAMNQETPTVNVPPLPPGADILERLGFYENTQPGGNRSFTNFDPATGQVNPRSQVPYETGGLGGMTLARTLDDYRRLAEETKGLPPEAYAQAWNQATEQPRRYLTPDERAIARAKKEQEDRMALLPPKVPAGGGIADKQTGEIFEPTDFTQADLTEKRGRYKIMPAVDRQGATYIENTVLPAVQEMKQLIPKVAVEAKGENLANWLKKVTEQKLGVSPDVQRYLALRTTVALEESRIISGQNRIMVKIFEQLENTTLPQLRQTAGVQGGLLDNFHWQAENRLRGLKGQAPISSLEEWKKQQVEAAMGRLRGQQ